MLPVTAEAITFDRMYVFGDSLSDPGNIYNATKAANAIPPELLPPGTVIPPIQPLVPPYDSGGRFSNGLNWADYLAQDLGIDLKASTTLSVLSPQNPTPSPITFLNGQPVVSPFFNGATATNSVNFAFGAAQTGQFGAGEFGQAVPGVLTQVGFFANDLAAIGQKADEDALYVVFAGPNDYQTVPDSNPVESVGNLATAIQSLYALGARNFLVPNLPDLGKTPRALSPNPPVASDILTAKTVAHNTLLDNAIDSLEGAIPDINIIGLDVFSELNKLRANPGQFGFTNVTDSCLNETTFTICNEPDNYLFWDGIHPTTEGHKQLAQAAWQALSPEPKSVPEPTSPIALGLLGLGGFLYGKSKKKSAQKAELNRDTVEVS
ncbi:MAG TPA: phospholipase [Cyanobacteria bacterium UBA11149]|nr:phospholipase [Cyanobacteria bacterium UBA11367]HBE57358.1 phospholipase [Cyanobacteria bacterium UBA11366]HBK66982.1 phospholipase [Cyanobacteria bacterium UBA11166]HBR76830.1 phospholipase [Cyanobacteria bacterium UBA11159]HBS72587.1 phospholipase [Cyanobacteria bacterium UBA11153]HBW90590.1 phospholipase [Cyanobacteria bacterium UBA11149]HCA94896.1 phospholipase [Cyanobacteria bacterium UBA9226]